MSGVVESAAMQRTAWVPTPAKQPRGLRVGRQWIRKARDKMDTGCHQTDDGNGFILGQLTARYILFLLATSMINRHWKGKGELQLPGLRDVLLASQR